MGIRQDFERRIAKKQQEIADLELQLRDARSYLQALQDSMKMIPQDMLEEGGSGRELRVGSSLYKAREALRKSGKPLHINELLKAIGKPVEKKSRLSLSGSLAAYVRKNEIFTRPGPNTFGLHEFDVATESELPESFGQV
jgi:hypothetical protein